ncbi:hypothetical protein D3C87_1533060 [compost metagenome]
MHCIALEDGVSRAEQSGERFGREFHVSREDASWRGRLPRNLRIHDVSEDAVGTVAGFTNRHRAELEVIEDVTEAGIDIHRRQPELRYLPRQSRRPEIGGKGKGPSAFGGRLLKLRRHRGIAVRSLDRPSNEASSDYRQGTNNVNLHDISRDGRRCGQPLFWPLFKPG